MQSKIIKLTKYKNPIVFYLSLLLIPAMMYRNSWLPGASVVLFNEVYISIFLCSMILLLGFDLNEFLYMQLRFSLLERKILFFLTFAAFVTVAYNPIEFTGLKSSLSVICYVMLFTVYFYWIPKFLVLNPSFFEKFIKIISNGGLFFSLLGFIFLIFNFNPRADWSAALLSIIGHPNNTSIIMTISFVPTLLLIYWKWNEITFWSKCFYIASLLIQIAAQLFTFTRAGMIATVIGLFVFFALYHRSKFLFALPFLVILIPVIGLYFFRAKGFASFLGRFYLLIPAAGMIFQSNERMLWGYGLTNGMVEYRKNLVAFSPNEFHILDPHNTYVSLILMLGMVFTALLLFFVVSLILKYVVKTFKEKDRSKELFYIFLISSTVSIMTQGLFDTELIKIEYFTIHYLLIVIGLMYFSSKSFIVPLKSNIEYYSNPVKN